LYPTRIGTFDVLILLVVRIEQKQPVACTGEVYLRFEIERSQKLLGVGMSNRLFERNQLILMVLSVSLGTVSLILPQYVIFWQERGVEGAGPSFLEGAFAVIFALASVPAGMVADKFGRRRVLMLGCLLQAIGFGQYYFNYGVIDFLISEALIGIGMAAAACSTQALLVESIAAAGGTEQYELKMTARMKIFSYSTFILGAPLGGWLAVIKAELPFFLASLGPLIGFGLAIFITETASKESEERARFGFKEMFALRHRLFSGDTLSGLYFLFIMY
jgi:MFS family permease